MPTKNREGSKDRAEPGERLKGDVIRACYRGDAAFVRRMLEQGADPDMIHDNSGSRPLTSAADGGHLSIVRLLLEAGANPNAQDTWRSMPPRGTALEAASQRGHLEIAKLLVERGADVNKAGYWPPLKAAASHGQPETVRFLLSVGARFEPSIIMLAVRARNPEVVGLLLRAGVAVNYRNSDGQTPLHVAAVQPSAQIVEALIAAGADLDVQTKRVENTPLHDAASRGRVEVARVLVAAGASLRLKNFKGKTAEQWARLYGHNQLAHFLEQHRKGSREASAGGHAKGRKTRGKGLEGAG